MGLFFKKIIHCIFFFLAIGNFANGQVRISAVASPTEVDVDEYVKYSVIVENTSKVTDIKAPEFNNFQFIDGPLNSTSTTDFNGSVRTSIGFTFILRSKKKGKFILPPSVVVVDGKTIKTNPVSVLVTDHPFEEVIEDNLLHRGETIGEKANNSIQFRIEVDKTSCYVGEPVVATYKLYSRLKPAKEISKNPTFNGFSVVEMPTEDVLSSTEGTLDGKQYNVYVLRRSQLYPFQAGPAELEPAEMNYYVQLIKEEYRSLLKANLQAFFNDDPFSLPPGSVVAKLMTVKSKPVSITVKPLPETGKPASFNGAVGDFTIESYLQNDHFTTDEPGVLYVEVNGSGDMQLLTPPEINWPSGIEAFDPVVSDEFKKETVPISGAKVFKYTLSINNPGSYKIPSFQFSFFNPKTGKYDSLQTKEIAFSVSKGTGTPLAAGKIVKKEAPAFLNNIFHHRWLIILFVAMLIIGGLIVWVRREKKNPVLVTTEGQVISIDEERFSAMAEESAVNQQSVFAETEKCLQRDDCLEFYSILNTELKCFISKKFSLSPAEVNAYSVGDVMDRRGISNETILELQSLMREIEWQLYTPFERTAKMNELYSRSQELVQVINNFDFKNR